MITANAFYGHAKRSGGLADAGVTVKRSRATAKRPGTDDGSTISYALRHRPATLENADIAASAMRGVDGSITVPSTGVSVNTIALTGAAARSAVTALLTLDAAYIAPPDETADDGADDGIGAGTNGTGAAV